MSKRVFIVPGFMESAYQKVFAELGYLRVAKIEDATLVCFGGGADISPSLYNQKPHPTVYTNPARDKYEVDYYHYCVTNDIPAVGVCRGAQLINVLNGGSLYQDVSSHCGSNHTVLDLDTQEIHVINSVHHQMMRVPQEGKIVAIANMIGRKEYMESDRIVSVTDDLDDPEVVWFPHTRSLCFQGHPEFGDKGTTLYFNQLIQRFFE